MNPSMPSPLRAIQLVEQHGYFQPRLTEITLPAPGPQEVLLQVEAVSLNYRDLLIGQNAGGDTRNGMIPLSDVAASVLAVGSEVSRWQVGDRVSPTFFRDWQQGPYRKEHLASALGGAQVGGVLAERILAPEHALVAIPEHLTATLPCAAVTAWQALFSRGGLQAGETVLLQGTGGVALFGLQLAVAQGARAIVLSSSAEKLRRAEAMGAWACINYREVPQWEQAVLELTAQQGVDHVLELGGPATYNQSIAALAAGGRIAQIGVLTGFGSQPNLTPLQFLNGSIHGICVGSGEDFQQLNRFLGQHGLRPVIDRIFTFEQSADAYDYLQRAEHFGKVVIEVTHRG